MMGKSHSDPGKDLAIVAVRYWTGPHFSQCKNGEQNPPKL